MISQKHWCEMKFFIKDSCKWKWCSYFKVCKNERMDFTKETLLWPFLFFFHHTDACFDIKVALKIDLRKLSVHLSVNFLSFGLVVAAISKKLNNKNVKILSGVIKRNKAVFKIKNIHILTIILIQVWHVYIILYSVKYISICIYVPVGQVTTGKYA